MIKNIIVITIVVLLTGLVQHASSVDTLTQEQALFLARQSNEAREFYDLEQGSYADCIATRVDRPCETDWVTCIDDAWVVKFEFSEACQIDHDGRLSLTILVDAVDKKILSRFPEEEYLINQDYCLEDYDCMYNEEKDVCFNFIYGFLEDEGVSDAKDCACQENLCMLD